MLRRILLSIALLITGTPGQAAPATITDITVKDELGYACIAPEHLEEKTDEAALAFRLTGKMRMPRTCLPDPCSAALSPRDLSNLTGTPVSSPRFADEWEDYYARYADHCRAEVTPFVTDDPLLDGDPPRISRLKAPPLGPFARLTPPLQPLLQPPSNPLLPRSNQCRTRSTSDAKWLMRGAPSNACLAGSGSALSFSTGSADVPIPAPVGFLIAGVLALGWAGRNKRGGKC